MNGRIPRPRVTRTTSRRRSASSTLTDPPVRSGTVGFVSEQLHLTIRYSDAGDGWVTAQVAEIPGAISQGKTREEAKANVLDALDVLLTPDEQLAGESSAEDSESLTLTVAS